MTEPVDAEHTEEPAPTAADTTAVLMSILESFQAACTTLQGALEVFRTSLEPEDEP